MNTNTLTAELSTSARALYDAITHAEGIDINRLAITVEEDDNNGAVYMGICYK